MDPKVQKVLERYSGGHIPYNGTGDYLRAKFKADDRYWAYKRRWREDLRETQQRLHKEYGQAPEWAHEEVRAMKAEDKLEFLPAYMMYLIGIKQGNRLAVESEQFVPYWDIRKELGFDCWLAVHKFPFNIIGHVDPTPNWDKVRPPPAPTKVEADELSGSITIWSW